MFGCSRTIRDCDQRFYQTRTLGTCRCSPPRRPVDRLSSEHRKCVPTSSQRSHAPLQGTSTFNHAPSVPIVAASTFFPDTPDRPPSALSDSLIAPRSGENSNES